MCGIVGFMQDKSLADPFCVLKKMMDKIAHRGPDGSGFYIDGDIALGHRRLSIIDVNGGEQPMKNEDKSLICVFNGEIYNYKELREYLITKGHIFNTKSDTEVLLHGYEEWGYELPKKLRGMFSFALWDTKKEVLYCARDYFGVKPFYYYKEKDCFMFASEIKSFLEHPGFKKELNKRQLGAYLSYQYSPGNETFFENVYKLPPAHYMVKTKDSFEVVSYWQADYEADKNTSLDKFAEEIGEAVKDSVRAHKISDVEVGSFLSSGVDSAYLSSVSDVDKTFTLGYEDGKYDESSLVKPFAETNHLNNYARIVSKTEFFDKVEEIQYYMDEPLADAACVSLYLLDEEAAKHVKVCLSGEGADELFGGYNIYKEPFMCRKYNSLAPFIKRGIGAIAELFPAMPGRNFLVRHARAIKERYIGPTCLFSEKEKKKLLVNYKEYCNGREKKKTSGPEKTMDDVTYMQTTDINRWLVGDILLKADKMSMAHSLEVRVPYLDKEVFEIAKKIPVCYRANNKETKIAFRKSAEHVIGEEVAERTKRGFPVPIKEWIKEEPYYKKIKECFESPMAGEFFNNQELVKMLNRHVSGKCDCWRNIWCIYVFLLWYEVFFYPPRKSVA
ncbi:MAG: asparagine synthase (glutamine-hydrolyzing) [Lachnospiraceae bacterium]|nr:asparagine synthase (glutamine-hydrolyzing) [Lachnospiraceae bacterium]